MPALKPRPAPWSSGDFPSRGRGQGRGCWEHRAHSHGAHGPGATTSPCPHRLLHDGWRRARPGPVHSALGFRALLRAGGPATGPAPWGHSRWRAGRGRAGHRSGEGPGCRGKAQKDLALPGLCPLPRPGRDVCLARGGGRAGTAPRPAARGRGCVCSWLQPSAPGSSRPGRGPALARGARGWGGGTVQ